jgi:hypothetical protein
MHFRFNLQLVVFQGYILLISRQTQVSILGIPWTQIPIKVEYWLIPDDGGSTYLWNVGRQLFYMAVHPRRQFWNWYFCSSSLNLQLFWQEQGFCNPWVGFYSHLGFCCRTWVLLKNNKPFYLGKCSEKIVM